MSHVDLSFLPAVNASFNAIATVLIVIGWVMIKRGQRDGHRRCMVGAFLASVLFLVCYLTHYYWRMQTQGGMHTSPNLDGIWRTLYVVFLIVHIVFAGFVPVLAVAQIVLAVRGRWVAHRRLGRITVPVWLYTGVTGVLIYFILYWWFPPVAP